MSDKLNGKYELWTSHDAHAHSDRKIKLLINRFGFAGYGRYWKIIEMMLADRSESHYALKLSVPTDYEFLAMELQMEPAELDHYLAFCTEITLFILQAGLLSSPSLTRRMSKLEEAKQMRLRRSIAGANKRWGKSNPDLAIPEELPQWFAPFVGQFRNEYPKGAKSFIGAETVDKELYKAVLDKEGKADREIAKQIVIGCIRFRRHIESISEDEEKFELMAATKWIINRGWLNNYGE